MNNLAKYRGKHGLTQTELGEKLGISKAGVSFIEKNQLSLTNALKCAKVLNENHIALMGTDALKVLPSNDEEKQILIDIIRGL